MTECEHTFEIGSTPAQAWKALEDVSIAHAEPGTWWLPGFESAATEIERDRDSRLTVRKTQQPCEGTLITITFEHVDTGTRVRIVQSGFDDAFVHDAGESFWIHAQQIFADFELFLVTGVIARRAWRSLVWLGVSAMTVSYGVQVVGVQPGSWAERVGLHVGDTLLTVANAPLFSTRDLGTVQCIVRAGDEVRATWVRGGARMAQAATA